MTEASDIPARWRVFAYHKEHAGRGPMFVGMMVLLPLLVIFVLWSALAPLNAAAIAVGEIVLSSERKTVQHLEGGLVTQIYVSEGMRVDAGQPLLEVQDLHEQAQIASLGSQLVNANAQIARLLAENEGLDAPDFSDIAKGLLIEDETVARYVALHQGVFDNMTSSALSVVDLAESRKVQTRREIEGLQAQLDGKKQEAKLVGDDLTNKKDLFGRGIVSEVQLNAVERDLAVINGEVGSLTAQIAKLEQSILDQDVAILQQKNDRRTALLDELQQAQVSSEGMRQELRTIQDRLARSIIRSPVSGVVLGMQVHTIGAVVAAGVPLMDVVPEADELIISARVNPTDIDLVAPGGAAEVMLSAYKATKIDKLDAVVETVSGDILTDELSGERYFEARLRVEEPALANLPSNVSLSPGMPADVFLIAGERTLAQYLLAPILDAATRAFRED